MRIEFWSSVECNAFLTGLIRELRASGHEVVHCYQVANDEYRNVRGRLERLWLRVRMYGLYPLQLVGSLLWDRQSCVSVVSTNTFFAPLLATLVAGRRRRIVHLVYDLFPDALVQAGVVQAGSALELATAWITRATFRRCSANVFLGEHLRKYAESRYGIIRQALVIPVGADGRPFEHEPIGVDCDADLPGDHATVPNPIRGASPITILYCGNMGRMHDVSTLVATLRERGGRRDHGSRLRDTSIDHAVEGNGLRTRNGSSAAPGMTPEQVERRDLHFVFHATGSGYAQLRENSFENQDECVALGSCGVRISFSDELNDADWERIMRSADVALVTVAAGAERVVMPSKVYSAMVAGQAVLAICARESDLADVVLNHDCGWVVAPGDVDDLREVLRTIQSHPEELLKKRRNAWRIGHSCYDVKVLAQQWLIFLAPESR